MQQNGASRRGQSSVQREPTFGPISAEAASVSQFDRAGSRNAITGKYGQNIRGPDEALIKGSSHMQNR